MSFQNRPRRQLTVVQFDVFACLLASQPLICDCTEASRIKLALQFVLLADEN